MCRDRVELNLSRSPSGIGPVRSKVYVQMAGVEAFYRELTGRREIAVPLADRAYGMRDFRLVDPAGNELSFGEPTRS